MFQLALQKEVTTVYDVEKVRKMLHKADKKIR
jgi:hypothetical protein